VATLEPLGPTVELARAYATFASNRMLVADYDGAIALALRARELADRFGATDVHSDALNTEAASASAKGQEWAGLMHRALDIALTEGHHDQAARAYTNLCAVHACRREFAEVERYLAEGLAYCEEHDMTTYATFLRGEQSSMLDRTGRWEEAIALCTELLTTAVPSPANRLRVLIRLGGLRARLGRPDAWQCLDEAAVTADESGEPPLRVTARLVRAEAYWLEGRLDEARREAELADNACAGCDSWLRGAVAVWLRRTGSARSAGGKVAKPYRLLLDGDPVRAAEAWTQLGCPYDAAMALAEAPDQAPLREALTILVGLGARPAALIIRRRLRELGARSIPADPRADLRRRTSGRLYRRPLPAMSAETYTPA
jgi:ATP/maltotriose-dependent transcriptional regulator MalT